MLDLPIAAAHVSNSRHGFGHHGPAVTTDSELMGTVPQWVSALATLIAFGWAVFLYRRSLRDRRLEQPRLVYALPISDTRPFDVGDVLHPTPRVRVVLDNATTLAELSTRPVKPDDPDLEQDVDEGDIFYRARRPGGCLRVIITNDSSEVITDVEVAAVLSRGEEPVGTFRCAEYLAPGSVHRAEVRWFNDTYSAFTAEAAPWVGFKDGFGRRWEHRTGSPIDERKEVSRWLGQDLTAISTVITRATRRVGRYFRPA